MYLLDAELLSTLVPITAIRVVPIDVHTYDDARKHRWGAFCDREANSEIDVCGPAQHRQWTVATAWPRALPVQSYTFVPRAGLQGPRRDV